MMIDSEKAIKGLEGIYRCISPENHTCGDCPYQDNHVECRRRVVSDAIALLKKYEPRKPYRHYVVGEFWYNCGSCRAGIIENDKYCHECGQAVKWE